MGTTFEIFFFENCKAESDHVTRTAEGDCGAWVIDANTNKLYGQIVAGLEGTEIAYIALLNDVFADISAQLHVSNVTFSTEENLTKTREDPMLPQVDSGKRRKGRQRDEELAWDRSYILSFGKQYFTRLWRKWI